MIEPLESDIKGYYKAFGIFLLTLLPSALGTGDPLVGIGEMAERWIYRWLPFFVIPLFIRDTQLLKKMFVAVTVAVGLDCLTASFQFFSLHEPRPNGFGGHYLHLATILSFFTPILTIVALDERLKGWGKTVATIGLVCCLVGILVGNSRGAWLALAVTLPLISWPYLVRYKKYACVAGLICCLVAGLFVVHPTYHNRLLSITDTTTDRSNIDRLLMWESASRMIQDHPVIGVGPNQFRAVYEKHYTSPKIKQRLKHAHNLYLNITAEYGIIGLCGFGYFICYLLRRMYRSAKRDNPYARMCLGGMIGFLLFSIFEYSLNVSILNRLLAFGLAILIVLSSRYDSENRFE